MVDVAVRATVFRQLAEYEGLGAGVWHAVGTRMHTPVYPHVAAALDLQSDDRLLDVGCGAGVFLAEQAAGVGQVAGLDASGNQVASAPPAPGRPPGRRDRRGRAGRRCRLAVAGRGVHEGRLRGPVWSS